MGVIGRGRERERIEREKREESKSTHSKVHGKNRRGK